MLSSFTCKMCGYPYIYCSCWGGFDGIFWKPKVRQEGVFSRLLGGSSEPDRSRSPL